MDKADTALNCMCFRGTTENGTDHSIALNLMSEGNVDLGEWNVPAILSSVVSVFYIVRSNSAVKDLSPQLSWRAHRF